MSKEPLGHRLRAWDHVHSRIGKDVPNTQIYAHQMRSVLAPLGSKMAAVVSMYANPSPTETKAAVDRKIITTAQKLGEYRKQTLAEAHKVYRNGLLDLDLRIGEKVKLGQPSPYGAELRAALARMQPGDRAAAVMQMVARNDGPQLACLLDAPGLISGLTEEEKGRYRQEVMALHAADELSEQQALSEAFQTALEACDVVATLVKDLSDPVRLADIERGVQAAELAEKAFESSENK